MDSGELQVRLSLLLGQVLCQFVKEVERIEVVTTIHSVEVEARETVTTHYLYYVIWYTQHTVFFLEI